MRRIREEVEELLVRASSAQVWGEGLAQEFQGALTAVRAVQRGEYEEADRALTEAIASPTMEVFRTELLFARGKARYLLQRFDGAVEDLERVRAVRSEWADAWYFVAAVRAGAGIALGREGKDPRTALAKAVEGGEARGNPRHLPITEHEADARRRGGRLADYGWRSTDEAVPY